MSHDFDLGNPDWVVGPYTLTFNILVEPTLFIVVAYKARPLVFECFSTRNVTGEPSRHESFPAYNGERSFAFESAM
jgi:hypothetical protein